MSDQELAQAMRDLIARQTPGLPDARQLSEEVMRRDRCDIRLLAACSIFFWLLTAGLLFLVRRPGSPWSFVPSSATFGVDASIVSLLVAALFTVWLVFSFRRATLRQINIKLMEISEQLKQLRRPPPA